MFEGQPKGLYTLALANTGERRQNWLQQVRNYRYSRNVLGLCPTFNSCRRRSLSIIADVWCIGNDMHRNQFV